MNFIFLFLQMIIQRYSMAPENVRMEKKELHLISKTVRMPFNYFKQIKTEYRKVIKNQSQRDRKIQRHIERRRGREMKKVMQLHVFIKSIYIFKIDFFA